MKRSGKFNRKAKEINAGSMADIAFLMLVFFLVVTQFQNDIGIMVKLPPYEPNPPSERISKKNLLSVKLNHANELMVSGQATPIEDLKETTMDFIMNPEGKKNMPSRPVNAIVSLQNDRGTSYNTYLQVYNELKAAYNTLWEREAQQRFGKSYEALKNTEKKSIRNAIPLVISEAEPSDFVSN